jgi:hypothetical protein
MALQAALGLAFPGEYRDEEWIRLSWWGNDLVTLLFAAPALVASAIVSARGSRRASLVELGVVGYGVYNYAFYAYGAALNRFFILYVVAVVLSGVALIARLGRMDVSSVAARLPATPVRRGVAAYLGLVATGLAAVWVGSWAAYAFAGRLTPIEPGAFRLVAALDLTLMVPTMAAGGHFLWRARPWGLVISSLALVQGSLYLLVLAVNSLVAVSRGLVDAPGEAPIWGILFALTALSAAILFAGMKNTHAVTTETRGTLSP